MLGKHLFFVTLAHLDTLPVKAIGAVRRANRLNVKRRDFHSPALWAFHPFFHRSFLCFFCEIGLFCHYDLLKNSVASSSLENPHHVPARLDRLLEGLAGVLQKLDVARLTDGSTHSNTDCHGKTLLVHVDNVAGNVLAQLL